MIKIENLNNLMWEVHALFNKIKKELRELDTEHFREKNKLIISIKNELDWNYVGGLEKNGLTDQVEKLNLHMHRILDHMHTNVSVCVEKTEIITILNAFKVKDPSDSQKIDRVKKEFVQFLIDSIKNTLYSNNHYFVDKCELTPVFKHLHTDIEDIRLGVLSDRMWSPRPQHR